MIPAHKIAPFNFVLRRWLEWAMRRRFHGVYVWGGEHLRGLDRDKPVVGCVNHTNWWDGFVLYMVSAKLLPHDIYLAMEERNLRRYQFFTWLGVFGLDLSTPHAALAGLRYALRLLTPGRLIWMFVQGRLMHPSVPIEVRPGALFLAQRRNARVLPLILRYEWLQESWPSILIAVGESMAASTPPEELARALGQMNEQLEHAARSLDFTGAEPLFPARMSMNKRWDYLRHRLWRRREVFHPNNG